MDRFVRVRLIKANGLDLERIEVDWDLTLAVIFLKEDGTTVLGRFGTLLGGRDPEACMSLDGLAASMRAALELHEQGPAGAKKLAGKKGRKPSRPTPEQFPSLSRYQKDLPEKGKVSSSCIHCHNVREAERSLFREGKSTFPESALLPWPDPALLGLDMDPDTSATVRGVASGSPAGKAGVQAKDRILLFGGQPPISIADLQWVLHGAPEAGKLELEVERDGKPAKLSIALEPGWRRDRVSWRGSSWDLRRMALGGLLLEVATDSERAGAGVEEGAMALRVQVAGEHGQHGTARKAGFAIDDVLVEIDGKKDLHDETAVFTHLLTRHAKGAKVKCVVMRDGKRLELTLPQQ